MDIVILKRNRKHEPTQKLITSLHWFTRRIAEYHHDAQAAQLAHDTIECGGSYTYSHNGLSFEARAL